MPAAEISEQISLAGTDASGTGNMKFMINGAITLGTLDGANVEINEAVGENNILIFGMTSDEVDKMKKHGYNPIVHYNNNPILKRAIDEIAVGFEGIRFDNIANSLMNQDQYMVLADFEDYSNAQQKASKLYLDKHNWNHMSIVNIAHAGRFASDRAISDYSRDIWGAKPVK